MFVHVCVCNFSYSLLNCGSHKIDFGCGCRKNVLPYHFQTHVYTYKYMLYLSLKRKY